MAAPTCFNHTSLSPLICGCPQMASFQDWVKCSANARSCPTPIPSHVVPPAPSLWNFHSTDTSIHASPIYPINNYSHRPFHLCVCVTCLLKLGRKSRDIMVPACRADPAGSKVDGTQEEGKDGGPEVSCSILSLVCAVCAVSNGPGGSGAVCFTRPDIQQRGVISTVIRALPQCLALTKAHKKRHIQFAEKNLFALHMAHTHIPRGPPCTMSRSSGKPGLICLEESDRRGSRTLTFHQIRQQLVAKPFKEL